LRLGPQRVSEVATRQTVARRHAVDVWMGELDLLDVTDKMRGAKAIVMKGADPFPTFKGGGEGLGHGVLESFRLPRRH
jgi:hypothetical protein